MKSVFGKFLEVDLTDGSFQDYQIPEDWYHLHLGGRGLAVRILAEEMTGDEDPMSPQNLLIFSTGPLQGTGLGGAGRHCVAALSPKTGAVSDSYAGGFFGHELGKSGYDGIIFRGQSSSPVYLSIENGVPKLHDAGFLWGKTTYQTEDILREEHENVRVSSIGPGGENLVSYSCVINDKGRAAGRPGFGALMGLKKLKAVAVSGDQEKPLDDPEKFAELKKEVMDQMTDEGSMEFGEHGTTNSVLSLSEMGILPTKNFQKGEFEGAKQITGERMTEEILTGRDTCTGCPIRCKRVVETEFEGEAVEGPGPEYETLASFGSLCENDNLDAIALANQKCNEYSLDTISMGVTIAYLMEAAERGKLSGDLDKFSDLNWGDASSLVKIIDAVAYREGVGDEIAKGVDYLEEKLETDFAQQLKGQEIPMHEPRGKKGLGISYATSPRGATHLEGMHDTTYESTEPPSELLPPRTYDRTDLEGKPELAKAYEDLMSFTNSAILCRFPTFNRADRYNYPTIRKALSAATGYSIDAQEMQQIGERNLVLLKHLASKRGFDRQDDDLTSRFQEPLPSGATEGESLPREQFSQTIDEYYRLRGYGQNGPTEEKMRELGLDDILGK